MKPTRGEKIFSVFNYTLMGLLALTMLLPVIYILQLTLSGHPDPSFRLSTNSLGLCRTCVGSGATSLS